MFPSPYPPSSVLTYLFAICSDQRHSVETSLLTIPSPTPHQEHHQYPPPQFYSSSPIQRFLLARPLDTGVATLPVATLPSLPSLQLPHCSSGSQSRLLQSGPTRHITCQLDRFDSAPCFPLLLFSLFRCGTSHSCYALATRESHFPYFPLYSSYSLVLFLSCLAAPLVSVPPLSK